MKPQSESDLKRAFINCLNKLAWSQRKGYGILYTYEKMLGKSEQEKNADRLAEIEKLLDEKRKEARRLNAVIMRERFLPQHREKKMALTNQSRELLAERNKILNGSYSHDFVSRNNVPLTLLNYEEGLLDSGGCGESNDAENAYTGERERDKVFWKYYSDGTLHIKGSGDMSAGNRWNMI